MSLSLAAYNVNYSGLQLANGKAGEDRVLKGLRTSPREGVNRRF
jgi:hypothetical protein